MSPTSSSVSSSFASFGDAADAVAVAAVDDAGAGAAGAGAPPKQRESLDEAYWEERKRRNLVQESYLHFLSSNFIFEFPSGVLEEGGAEATAGQGKGRGCKVGYLFSRFVGTNSFYISFHI